MEDKGLDQTTMRGGGGQRARSAASPSPMMTIAWHPDVERIGEVAALEPTTRLSRLEPEFAPPGGGRARPLADPNISRRPVTFRPQSDGDLDISVAAGTGSLIRASGVVLTAEHRLTREQIERGVVIELADRVVLVLHLGTPAVGDGPDHGLIGASDAVRWVRDHVDRVAGVDVSVLVRGPTGSGKELVARAIHASSPRASGPLVAVNMITMPPSTAASQLFGHAKGAFTGATADHDGFFAAADGGTLFLDEVGETPMDVQAMLLRTLETGELTPVGSTASRAVDVRVIAATDADLERAVSEQRFRSPLLHRLAGYQIALPPLKRRREDIGRLLLHFLRDELGTLGSSRHLKARPPTEPTWLSAPQVARLVAHPWPGNVRELRNVIRHIAISARNADHVTDDDLDLALHVRPAIEETEPGGALPATVARARRAPEDISDDELVEVLRAHAFKTSAAASALGISRTSLYALIERHPDIRKARDLEAAEITRALEQAGGDPGDAAASLQVSERGLKLRMRELHIGG